MAKWNIPFLKRRPKPEFREDAAGSSLRKLLHMTRQQKLTYLRWLLYVAVCLAALVIQDTIMSQMAILDATTDLVPAAILLIAVIENCEVGSVFALIASIVYFFSGSAPGAYCVALMTIPAMLCGLFRQKFWRRSTGSMILCSAIAMLIYEVGLYGVALFLGRTRFDRLPFFLLTALYSIAVMIPLYQLIYRIGSIGGHVWNE